MKVAVTGATGFIGMHVLKELETRSVESIAVVRSATDKTLEQFRCGIVELDLHKLPCNAFELMGCPDVVIHLAWSGLPNYNSLHHFEQELPAQYQFVKNLVESGLRNLVIAGSCAEYGMQAGMLSEEIEGYPCNSYGFAKDMLRRQLEYLRAIHPFQFTWTRLFYLYGDGQHESALLPQLRRAVERDDEIFNMSGGEQRRDFLPVTEVARYLVSLALAEKDIGAVNVCSGIPISVRELVEGWIKENNWSIRLNLGHYPYPDYEPMAFWGDPQKLSSLIGDASRQASSIIGKKVQL